MSTKAGDILKRFQLALISVLLLCTGCGNKSNSEQNDPNAYGPVVEQDTRSDEQKELEMIRQCINDYNINRIPEVEEYLGTQLHPLPLEVTSLPEISSLKDLKEEPEYLQSTNVSYAGSYMVDDKYKIIFLIYQPTGNSFWLNGRVLFQIDPSLVDYDKPEYAKYREEMDVLLKQERPILNWLYGLDLELGAEGPIPGYYEVTSMGGQPVASFNDVKAIAESVFTKEYLEQTFYYSAFYSEGSMFKEDSGKLYCAKSDLAVQDPSYSYNTHYIIAAEEKDGMVYLDMLGDNMGEVQPDIKRLTMQWTDNGYRLPSAY